ncbi:TolC family protein, partial [Sphingomonas sp. 37zxx]|uniref:TolC family protein n=1 Tax=Sphingomonas sp. 37zxx TaxID=1550073 RepID=UPI00053BDBFF
MKRQVAARRASHIACVATIACALLSGCSTGGAMPLLPVSLDTDWIADAGPEGAPPRQDWWRTLGGPALDALIVHTVSVSPTLQAAAAKVAQAGAQARISGAARKPQAGASGGLNYYRLPPELAQTLTNVGPGIAYAQLQIGSSWELDFWGRAKNAARADAYAHLGAEQDYRAALVSLIGQVANAYVQYRTNAARLAIAQGAAAAMHHGVALAEARRRSGATDAGDPAQARIAASQQDAQVAALKAAVAQARHAVALLAGMTQAEAAPLLDRPAVIPLPPASPDPGVPRDLLRARPDVMEAELVARAQYARLKSAKASLYPAFSLRGAIGFSATTVGDSSLTNLFSWDKRLISNGLSLTLPLFDHGSTNPLRGRV